MNNQVVNSFWVEGELTKHHWLTIKSFQNAGHDFVLWCYPDIRRSVPRGTILRDAREILPEEKIFRYKYMDEAFQWGGFAERLKSELLYELGGWHVDMDVTCLKYLDFDAEYVLRPHIRLTVANIIKCPPKSQLAGIYRQWIIEKIDENNQNWELSFLGLCKGVEELGLQDYIVGREVLGRDDYEWWTFLENNGIAPDDRLHAIHWCAAMRLHLNYQENSFYDTLMKRHCPEKLVPQKGYFG